MSETKPPAPGGMSEKALVEELVADHGWDRTTAKALSWPEKIDAVKDGRGEAGIHGMSDPEVIEEVEAEEETSLLELPGEDDESFDFRFDGHAGAGPSGASRWMNCTESLRVSRNALITMTEAQREEFAKASLAARQGTTAHIAGEVKLRHAFGWMTDDEMETLLLDLALNPDDEDEAYDEEMGAYVDEYVDYVRMIAADHEVSIESTLSAVVPLTGTREGEVYVIRGSGDTVGLPTKANPKSICVVDLKYGNGIDVSVESNPQIRIYGLGALQECLDEDGNIPEDLDTIKYAIAQPRLGGIKEWEESIDDLLAWRDNVLAPAVTAALFGEGAQFKPSEDACVFCPARGTCAALAVHQQEKAAPLFVEITDAEIDGREFPDTGLMTDEQLGEALEQAQALVNIEKDLKAEALRRMVRGQKVPGFKMVSYSPRRSWDSRAADVMANVPEAWEDPALKSPAKVEALIKKGTIKVKDMDRFKGLIRIPEKQPKAAAANDKRREWDGPLPGETQPAKTADEMFPED